MRPDWWQAPWRECPQGGFLSSLLCLVVVEYILMKLDGHGMHYQISVDDSCFLGKSLFPDTLSYIVQPEQSEAVLCGKWGKSLNASMIL